MRAIFDVLRKYHPNGKDLSPVSICSHIGIRDTNHYETLHQIKGEDLMCGKHFEDAIAYGTYPIDMHHSDSAGITFRDLDGTERICNDRISPAKISHWRQGDDYARYYEMPFKTLVQDRYSNFIAVGRMVNADETAFGAIRVMVNLNQLGETAGVAAYHCLHQNKGILEIDGNDVRASLSKGGSIIL